MAEFEVEATVDGEVDIDIDFSKYTDDQRMKLIKAIANGEKFTFEAIYVELTGDTFVEIEPMDYH